MTKRRTKLRVFAALSVSLALVGCRGSDDDDADVATEEETAAPAATGGGTDTTAATEATEAESTEGTAASGTEGTAAAGSEGTSAGTGGDTPMAPEVDCPESEPGLTDTEITIGGSYPLSGPVAAYGVIPVAIKAWFDYLNETQGGITAGDGVTRRINWTYLDDQYQPPRTLENVRRLVEQDNVWLVFNPLGTPPNVAIREYMNGAEVPQLYVATGASMWGNEIEEFPWTIGYQPDYESEGIAYAQYALSENPDARVGILYANDDFGRDYVTGIREGMGDAADQIVAEVTYETTDATIDSQVSQVIDSGADVFMLIATPQFAIQGIQRTAALGYEGTKIVTSVSSSVGAVIEPAGRDVATDWITSVYLKDPTDPEYDDDPGMMQYQEILAEYAPDANPDDGFNVYGMSVAQLFQHTLESMPTLCRAAIMEAAKNLDWADPPLLIEGIGITTGEGDAFPIQQVQLQRWTGDGYEKFGEIIDAADIND
jgi:branched-chain amino acid transport system substrate-binding protein